MPAEHEWYIERRVMLFRFIGNMTVEEVVGALETSAHTVNNSQGEKVHFLHDWSQLEKFPTNILQLRRDTKAAVEDWRKLGWMVAFGAENRLLRYISQTVLQVFKIRFRMFVTREEAWAFLETMDPSLSELKPQ